MYVIKHKTIFLAISAVFFIAAIAALLVLGLKPGIDFTGGSLLEVEYLAGRPDVNLIREQLEGLDLGGVTIQPIGEKGYLLRFRQVDENTHQAILTKMAATSSQQPTSGTLLPPEAGGGQEATFREGRFDTIGPTIGAELRRRSLLALVLALAAIIIYIAWSFRRVAEPISSWKYGIIAVAALVHDVTIPAGVFAILGKFHGVEIDALFITALLTVLGFSVSDTIVVFDRIRENLLADTGREPFARVIGRSLRETAARSLITSFVTLLVLGAVFLFGGPSVTFFALALMLGIFFGMYSSIFVASPLLVLWHDRAVLGPWASVETRGHRQK